MLENNTHHRNNELRQFIAGITSAWQPLESAFAHSATNL